MKTRTLRSAVLALSLSLVLTPAVMAFPAEGIPIQAIKVLEEYFNGVFGDDGHDYVDNQTEVTGWGGGDGPGGGSGGGDEPSIEAR